MNNTKHITDGEWFTLFSRHTWDKERMLFQSRIMAHVNQCDECRAFYDKAIALRDAAMALAEASARTDEGAFQAVASAGSWQPRKGRRGSLSVCIAIQAGGAQFVEETLDQTGLAEKYAMNLESEGKCLNDDGEEVSLVLKDSRLLVEVREPDVSCRWQLIAEDIQSAEGTLTTDGSVNEITLPPDGFITLEITFEDRP